MVNYIIMLWGGALIIASLITGTASAFMVNYHVGGPVLSCPVSIWFFITGEVIGFIIVLCGIAIPNYDAITKGV